MAIGNWIWTNRPPSCVPTPTARTPAPINLHDYESTRMFNTLIRMSTKNAYAAVLGLALTGSALAASPLQEKNATLQCADRRVTVEGTCFQHIGPVMMCTQQAIRFFDAAGKPLGARIFPSTPTKGIPYPTVEEQFGELNCVETKTKEKFVVATMDNGGNCERCEWIDVYSLDGALVGSTRDNKIKSQSKNARMDAAIGAAYGEHAKHILSRQPLTGFYENTSAK